MLEDAGYDEIGGYHDALDDGGIEEMLEYSGIDELGYGPAEEDSTVELDPVPYAGGYP